MMNFPSYTRAEYWADAAVHGLGVGFALIAGPILIGFVAAEGEVATIVAISIYVATLIIMFSASASYNMVPIGAAKQWLRRIDHSAIFLKIAGAYTPFAMVSLAGGSGYRLLGVVWVAALSGTLVKMVWPHRFHLLSLALYLAMGWAATPLAMEVYASVEVATWVLVLISGGLYTVGTIFHMWDGLRFNNVIWHVFVLVATTVMYAAMAVEFA